MTESQIARFKEVVAKLGLKDGQEVVVLRDDSKLWNGGVDKWVGQTLVVNAGRHDTYLYLRNPSAGDWFWFSPLCLFVDDATVDCFMAFKGDFAKWLRSPKGKTTEDKASEKPQTLCEMAVKALGVKVGDYVEVFSKWPDKEGGWTTRWVSEMDEAIGKVCPVRAVESNGNVVLGGVGENYSFPAIVLKKANKPPIAVLLSSDYTAQVHPDRVTVGCQTLSFAVCDELMAAINQQRGK